MAIDFDLITDTIRQSVSALQAGEKLGLNPDRSGRCACPMHNGKDRNLRLYDGERGFYCFVCHASGDVIRLVRETNSCGWMDAVRWLDGEFGLNLPLTGKTDPFAKRRARWTRMVRRWKREEAEAERELLVETNLAAMDYVISLENTIADRRPQRPEDDWDEEFARAVRELPEARETAIAIQMELMELNRQGENHDGSEQKSVPGSVRPAGKTGAA